METVKNEIALVESKELRDKMADRVEVLDKVKELLVLPQIKMMTVPQTAEFYEVSSKTVHECYRQNKEEIDADGAQKATPTTISGQFPDNLEIVRTRYYNELKLSDTVSLRVPNTGILLFPKRAILRIGMLLRDSEVAKEVRTQLLNIVEKVDEETATEDIQSEQDIILDLAQAFAEHDPLKMMQASQALYNFQSRHIAVLTRENAEVKQENELVKQENAEVKMENEVVKKENEEVKEDYAALAGEIVQWDSYDCINKAIRTIAGMANRKYGEVWVKFYDEMLYKNHINLKSRAGSSYYKRIRPTEMPIARDAVSATAMGYGLVPKDVFRKAHMLIETV